MTYALTFKNIVASTLKKIGIFNFLLKKRPNDAFVLMYHRVLPSLHKGKNFVQPGMYVKESTFSRQAAFLKERFNVLPLCELLHRIKSGLDVGGCCAITFDDGWRDNWDHAFPVLEQFQLPATVFLATGFIGTHRMFWPEELAYYMAQPEMESIAGRNSTFKRFLGQVQKTKSQELFLDAAISTIKNYPSEEREEILEFLRSTISAPPPDRVLINWEEANKMKESNLISFGAHTVNHVILDKVSLSEAETEIVRSRRSMGDHLGVEPELFAYPNGNYTPDLKKLLVKHGFMGAVTTRKDWVGQGIDLFEVPRIAMHEDVSQTIPLFEGRLLLKGF